ncbi:MAG: hypothetical protein AAF389_00660 [Gemmatimonadota bacterium]
MARCHGTTKKGEQCKRGAPDDSPFCSIHQDQEVRPRKEPTDWDTDAIMKAALGFAVVGAIFLIGFRR